MIALRTSLNGKELCLAGTEDLCVLNTTVNAVGKLGRETTSKRNVDESPDFFLNVGGLTARAESDDEHLNWIGHELLSVGDKIVISVEEVEVADLPIEKIPAKAAFEECQRHRFEDAKKTYFELRDKYEPETAHKNES